MAAYLFALYNQPMDADAFSTYLESEHIPLARMVPSVQSIHVSEGPALAPDGSQVFHRVGILRFESMDALQAAVASTEGQRAAADLENFATGGVTLAVFEARDVTAP